MELLLKVGVLWLSIGIVVAATVWYTVPILASNFPDWWKSEIIDDEQNL